MYLLTTLLAFSALVISSRSAALPANVKRCKVEDSKCLAEAVQDTLMQLAGGSKEMGLKSLDPLEIKTMHVPGHGGNVDLDQTYNNIKLYGLSSSTISSFTVDVDKCELRGEAFTPSLSVVADYILKGQLLVFPINGHGLSNNTLYNLKSSIHMVCEKFEKGDKSYIKIKEFRLKYDPESVNFYYDSVVDNPEISNEIRKVLNENSKLIFDEIKGDYEVSYGLVFKDVSNKIFTNIPINDIFVH